MALQKFDDDYYFIIITLRFSLKSLVWTLVGAILTWYIGECNNILHM